MVFSFFFRLFFLFQLDRSKFDFEPPEGEVQLLEIVSVLDRWGSSGQYGCGESCDLNEDGIVNVSDITALLERW